jgi:peptide/nickel transport system permease protein
MKGVLSFASYWPNAVAVVLVGAFVVLAAAAPLLAPLDASGVVGRSRVIPGLSQPRMPRPPGPGIPLGTLPGNVDAAYGLVWGSRSALRVGLTIAICTALLGVCLGAISGTLGGTVQEVLMRGTDALLAFPVIAGVAMFHLILGSTGASPTIEGLIGLLGTLQLTPVVLALICFSWMPYARLIDATIVQIRELSYVQAARALGASRPRIILQHLIPNAVSPAFIFVARDVGASVILVAAFTFIGLGQESEWGLMLVQGRDWVIGPGGNPLTYWWTYLPATAALLLFGIGWNLLGDGLHAVLILHTPRKPGRSWIDWLRLWMKSRWAPAAAALIVGIALGLTFGWVGQSAPPNGVTPAQLRDQFREDYLRAVIGSYAANHDPGLAVARFQMLGEFAESTLDAVRLRPRSVSSAAVRDFMAVIDPFRRADEALGSSMSKSGNFLAAVCLASVTALASLAAIFAVARRSLRHPRDHHSRGRQSRFARQRQGPDPP